MNHTILIFAFFAFCISVSAQKMNEPKLLGKLYTGGDDLSEFFAHEISDRTSVYLKDNPNGKLVVRICSSDEFSNAFVKSPVNPLAASNFNSSVPNETIYIAQSSKCFEKGEPVFNQYWFVPENSAFEYDKIIPVSDISYKTFAVDNYDFEKNKYESKIIQEKQFTENITKFIDELKNDPKAEGFIVHNSKNKTMKLNVEKVNALLKKENVSLQRVKTIVKNRMNIDRNGKSLPIEGEKKYFPELEVLIIKNKL